MCGNDFHSENASDERFGDGGARVNKTVMKAAGIVTAMSVAAATGLMMTGNAARRAAKSVAGTVEKTGRKMGKAISRMK